MAEWDKCPSALLEEIHLLMKNLCWHCKTLLKTELFQSKISAVL